jgi:WD40 repeat protein
VITAAKFGTGVANVWDTEYGVPIVSLYGHSRAINSAVFSPDGRSIKRRNGSGLGCTQGD